jgi:hypothetical protein
MDSSFSDIDLTNILSQFHNELKQAKKRCDDISTSLTEEETTTDLDKLSDVCKKHLDVYEDACDAYGRCDDRFSIVSAFIRRREDFHLMYMLHNSYSQTDRKEFKQLVAFHVEDLVKMLTEFEAKLTIELFRNDVDKCLTAINLATQAMHDASYKRLVLNMNKPHGYFKWLKQIGRYEEVCKSIRSRLK